jgi:hypothetical protein
MRSAVQLSVVIVVFVICSLMFTEFSAFAQCPPGTHWSERYWACVPNRRPPPPPPPPPGPPPGRGCNRSYQNCLMVCAGVPECVNNCNIGYNMCRQQGRW